MTKPDIISENPIAMAELKEELKKIRKRDEGLNFRAEQTEEYLNQFVSAKPKEASDLYKAIDDLAVPRLRPEHIIKIVDLMPTTPDEVKMILQGYTITVTKDNLKKIADTVKAAETVKGAAAKGDVQTEEKE
jgi:DNA-directed RNA polymerase subunit F